MAKSKSDPTASILEYALSHLEKERDEIQSKIEHIVRQLGGRVRAVAAAIVDDPTPAAPASSPAGGRKKRVLSAAARKRIAAAQRKRWAEHRKSKKTA